MPTTRSEIGDEFTCPLCGKVEKHTRSHEEMVALYETVYGEEYSPYTTKIACEECGEKIYRDKVNLPPAGDSV